MNVHILQIIICVGILAVSVKSQENDCFSSIEVAYSRCIGSIYEPCAKARLSNATLKISDIWKFLSTYCYFFKNNVDLHITLEIFDEVKANSSTLSLRHNKISLPHRIFCKLVDVQSIDLANNTLIEIKDIGFGSDCGEESPAMELVFLHIQDNKIKTFQAGAFQRLTNLLGLNASSNLLEEIEPGAFDDMLNLTYLELSNNPLEFLPPRVFRNLSKLKYLILSRNNLTSSTLSDVFFPESLKRLDLSNNRISTIDALMFKSLSKLTYLFLSYNQIRIIESGFASMTSLKALFINNSGIEVIKSEAFYGLRALRVLDLSDNKIKKLEPGTFSNIANLTEERMNGDNLQLQKAQTWDLKILKLARNEISDLIAFPSFHLRKLEELDLSENVIKIIETETFSNIAPYSLNLSHNKIWKIGKRAFDNLTMDLLGSCILNLDNNALTDIGEILRTTSVRSISLNYNNLTFFSFTSISIYLERISLSHNQISKITTLGFQNINIKFIDLSYNQIKNVSSGDFPQSLEDIALHNNSIEYINGDFLNTFYNVRSLTLHNNKLQMLCVENPFEKSKHPLLTTTLSGNPLICSCELEWLKYAHTDINGKFGYIKDFGSVKCHGMIPRYGTQLQNIAQVSKESMFLCKSTHQHSDCKCIYSKRSQCDMSCPNKCSCYRNSAFDYVIIDCFKSNLTYIPAMSLNNVPTLYLFADGNNISSIDESSFQSYSIIKRIFLNNSQLEKIEGSAFRKLTSLEILQLERNNLEILPDNIFEGLSNLKELYLTNNKLTQLQNELFSPLKSLSILRLNNNLLVKFPVWGLSKLKSLTNVGLRKNKWSCDCAYSEKFRTWLHNYSKIVDNANNVVCSEQPTGQEFPLISSLKKCVSPSQHLAPVWGSALGVLLLIFLVITFVFVYRREMQVLIYSRYSRRIFANNSDESDQNKPYDAFIAFSCLDEDFIINVLLPGLEQIENPFQLCLHQRDFLAGSFITDSILEAVEKSRRTILLLSENFIKSEWCRFEFKAAHIQMMKDRCNRVIIIVLGEIPKNLDPEIKLYLTTNTYLKWGDKLFWKKLYFALPDKNKNPA